MTAEIMLTKSLLPQIRTREIRIMCTEVAMGLPFYVKVRYEALRRFFISNPEAYIWYKESDPDLFKPQYTVTITTIGAMTPAARELLNGCELA